MTTAVSTTGAALDPVSNDDRLPTTGVSNVALVSGLALIVLGVGVALILIGRKRRQFRHGM